MLCISFFILLFLYIYLYFNFFPHSTFDNDDMKSSKGQVTFLSLIFLLKCFSKSITITVLSFLYILKYRYYLSGLKGHFQTWGDIPFHIAA